MLHYNWGRCGSTLMLVNDVFDPTLKSYSDYLLAASVLFDETGECSEQFSTTLVIGATIKLSKLDILSMGDRITLVARAVSMLNFGTL